MHSKPLALLTRLTLFASLLVTTSPGQGNPCPCEPTVAAPRISHNNPMQHCFVVLVTTYPAEEGDCKFEVAICVDETVDPSSRQVDIDNVPTGNLGACDCAGAALSWRFQTSSGGLPRDGGTVVSTVPTSGSFDENGEFHDSFKLQPACGYSVYYEGLITVTCDGETEVNVDWNLGLTCAPCPAPLGDE